MKSGLIRAGLSLVALTATASPALAQQDRCKQQIDIYFESGSANLLQSARETLLVAAGRIGACPAPLIILVAHTDSAEAKATPDIGQRRADAVAATLRPILGDVPVLTQDLGFTQPRRPTGPDVREPLNRRVTIFVQ